MYSVPGSESSSRLLSGPVLLAYARYLGIDPETEPSLLTVAREALTDPLPLGWERHLDEAYNTPFFYCNHGGFTSWQHPQLGHYLSKIDQLRRPQRQASQYTAGGPPERQPAPQPSTPPQPQQPQPPQRPQGYRRQAVGGRSAPPLRAAHEFGYELPKHSPAPRPSPAASVAGDAAAADGSPSWEQRWRQQQQQLQQEQQAQWQQWKHAPKVAARGAPSRPAYGASWEEQTAQDAEAEAEGEEEEPGLGELASWVGSAVRRTSRAVGSAASSAASAALRRRAAARPPRVDPAPPAGGGSPLHPLPFTPVPSRVSSTPRP